MTTRSSGPREVHTDRLKHHLARVAAARAAVDAESAAAAAAHYTEHPTVTSPATAPTEGDGHA